MAKDKAENLGEVLEMTRLRRHSGIILIEHKQGGKIEEGEVFFQMGQPIHARAGRLNGQDALNWIMRWHNITYTIGSDESLQPTASPTTTQRDFTPPPQTNVFSSVNPSTGQIVSQTQANGSGSVVRNDST